MRGSGKTGNASVARNVPTNPVIARPVRTLAVAIRYLPSSCLGNGAVMTAFVYILSNNTNTTVYTGVTNDLPRRIDEHRRHMNPDSFTAKYNITKLVYYERHENVWDAIAREKQIKGWNRKRKNDLVNSLNPDWKDLFPGLLEE